MNTLSVVFFWAGIVFLVDGSLGLLFKDKWQKLVGGLNIQRIAWIEIGVALALLATHYLIS